MDSPTLIRHESPVGPYWYHQDHPDCQDGAVVWESPEPTQPTTHTKTMDNFARIPVRELLVGDIARLKGGPYVVTKIELEKLHNGITLHSVTLKGKNEEPFVNPFFQRGPEVEMSNHQRLVDEKDAKATKAANPKRKLTVIEKVKPGGYFLVWSSTLGEIAFKKQSGDESTHTRLWDGHFHDPTFGDGTVVTEVSREQAIKIAEKNRTA
jgi:hypothetical protein